MRRAWPPPARIRPCASGRRRAVPSISWCTCPRAIPPSTIGSSPASWNLSAWLPELQLTVGKLHAATAAVVAGSIADLLLRAVQARLRRRPGQNAPFISTNRSRVLTKCARFYKRTVCLRLYYYKARVRGGWEETAGFWRMYLLGPGLGTAYPRPGLWSPGAGEQSQRCVASRTRKMVSKEDSQVRGRGRMLGRTLPTWS